MALSDVRVVVIDLDTLLLTGLEDYILSVKKIFPAKRLPQLWVWIPESFSGFYENKRLANNARTIDSFLVGKFEIGDLTPNQVLLFSRSVHTLLPIRQKKLCQTIVGDSLQVLECSQNLFDPRFKIEFTSSQCEYLQHRRKSKIFQYLKFEGTLEDLNRGFWIQERCEGVAFLLKTNTMIATSKDGITEWENIIKKELEYIPDKKPNTRFGSKRSSTDVASGSPTAADRISAFFSAEVPQQGAWTSSDSSAALAPTGGRALPAGASSSSAGSARAAEALINRSVSDEQLARAIEMSKEEAQLGNNTTSKEENAALELALKLSMDAEAAQDIPPEEDEFDNLAEALNASIGANLENERQMKRQESNIDYVD